MDLDQFNLDELSELPRDHIPDEWAHQGPCPVCDASNSLDVLHLSDAPDQFVCQKCVTAFEVLSKGSKIRLMTLPEVLKPAWMETINRWMSPEDIQRLYKRFVAANQPIHESAKEDISELLPETSLTNREVMFQAAELYQLGNDFENIKLLLFQAGATHQQVAAAIKRLDQRKQAQYKRRGCALWVMGLVAVLFFGLVAGILWFTSRPENTQGEAAETTILDAIIPQFDVGEMVSELAGIPTPQVINGGPAASRCPGNAQQAADLFGGEVSFWSEETGFRAWAMVNTGTPVTIRVPENMVAGYMKLDSMELISAKGPVTIQNLNFVVITCE